MPDLDDDYQNRFYSDSTFDVQHYADTYSDTLLDDPLDDELESDEDELEDYYWTDND